MARSTEPAAQISHLHRADGSATFSYGGYTVVASANGPIESQRRDEKADEAVVDVVVRPAAGVGGQSASPHVPAPVAVKMKMKDCFVARSRRLTRRTTGQALANDMWNPSCRRRSAS